MTPWLRRLLALTRRRRLDRELREELIEHVEARARRLAEDEGVPLEEARRRAAVSVDNITRLREESREQ